MRVRSLTGMRVEEAEDLLLRAVMHLKGQFSPELPWRMGKALLDAGGILLCARSRMLYGEPGKEGSRG